MIQTILLDDQINDQLELFRSIKEDLAGQGIEVHWYERPTDFVMAVFANAIREKTVPPFQVALVDCRLYDTATMREGPFSGEDVVRILKSFMPGMKVIGFSDSYPQKSFMEVVDARFPKGFFACNYWLAVRCLVRMIKKSAAEAESAGEVSSPVLSPEPVLVSA